MVFRERAFSGAIGRECGGILVVDAMLEARCIR